MSHKVLMGSGPPRSFTPSRGSVEKMYWDPKRLVLPPSSKSSPIPTERGQQLMTHDASAEGGNSSQPITNTGDDKGDVGASSSPVSPKPALRPTAGRPSLRRTRRIPSRAFPRPVRPRLSKISSSTKGRTSHEHNVTSPRDPSHRSLEPRVDNSTSVHGAKTFSEPPEALPFRTEGTYHNIGEGTRPVDKGRNEGDNIDGDEEEEEESEESEDSEEEDEGYEDETEGKEEAAFPTHGLRTTPSRGAQVNPQDTKPSFHQSSTVLPKPIRPAPHAVYPAPQGNHNRPPPIARRPPPRPDSTTFHYPPPETFLPRPASFATSRARPHHAPEGPQRTTWPNEVGYPLPFGPASRSSAYRSSGFSYSGDAPGPSSEWGEGSEAGGSERRSLYSLQSNMSVARSIYLEQQVARREEEAARREEEAMRKEEDARGLEMAARRAFAWVQGLEARAGLIHDAAMVAEAQAKRRDAEIWEREAEVLRRQAETTKREVDVAKREIAAERAEQQARRKARETRRKEAELLLKEEDVRRKEQEALRMEEDVRRKKMEIRWREEELLKREKGRRSSAPEDWMGTKDAVISAWEKLKGRISREPQVDKGSPARVHRLGVLDSSHQSNGINGTSESAPSAETRDISQDSSTLTNTPHPRNVQQWRTMVDPSAIPDLGDDDLRSVSNTVPSDSGTSAEVSMAYTVKTVHSYKERLHRSPAGYFRHVK